MPTVKSFLSAGLDVGRCGASCFSPGFRSSRPKAAAETLAMASGSESVTFREFCPLYSLLNAIPTKIQKGFRSVLVYLTALDANGDYIAVGSSVGMLYLYCRHLDRMKKYNCEVSPAVATPAPAGSRSWWLTSDLLDYGLVPYPNYVTAAGWFWVLACFFRAAPVAYGGCQARGRIGAAAAGLHHSHSNADP